MDTPPGSVPRLLVGFCHKEHMRASRATKENGERLLLLSTCTFPSKTWRSVFVSRRLALALSCPAHAGFRERRAAPFRVRAQRPSHCHWVPYGHNHEAQRPPLCYQAACGRDHESRRRRAPPVTNAPCGRHETRPASRRDTKVLRPALDLQVFPSAYSAQALLPCSRSNTNFTNKTKIRKIHEDS